MTPIRSTRTEQGGASLEMVILAPFMLALLMLMIAFARYAQTTSTIDQAARDGARAATAQNSRSGAPAAAARAVTEVMGEAPKSCRSSTTTVPTMSDGAFALPDPSDFEVEWVTVTVSCTVDLGDLFIMPLGAAKIERTFTSPVDRYRGYEQ
ncbi:MAG: pilus assembly protein [Nocardioides sp.]|nr:pilus assembly protein [Nocardioides sp.]